jgi:hypothetical protein
MIATPDTWPLARLWGEGCRRRGEGDIESRQVVEVSL